MSWAANFLALCGLLMLLINAITAMVRRDDSTTVLIALAFGLLFVAAFIL